MPGRLHEDLNSSNQANCDKNSDQSNAIDRTSLAKKDAINRTKSEGAASCYDHWPPIKSESSFDSGVDVFQDSYDHLGNDELRLRSRNSPKVNRSRPYSMANIAESTSPEFSGQASGFHPKEMNVIYTDTYEDAWDTKENQMKFNETLNQAQGNFPSDSNLQVSEKPNNQNEIPSKPSVPVYEDAWDTKVKQQSFEKKVNVMRKHSSDIVDKSSARIETGMPVPSAPPGEYDEPWQTGFQNASPKLGPSPPQSRPIPMNRPQPSKRSPAQKQSSVSPSQRALPNPVEMSGQRPPIPASRTSPAKRPLPATVESPAHRPVQLLPGHSSIVQNKPQDGPVFTDTYEAPWDSKQKEVELQRKMQKAGINSDKSAIRPSNPPSPGLPPEFAPPPPAGDMYEEAWEFKKSASAMSNMDGK